MENIKFTQEEQTEIVRLAATLETAVQDERAELNRLHQEQYTAPPKRPTKPQINTNVAPVAPDYSALPRFTLTFNQYLANECNQHSNPITLIYKDRPIARGFIASGALAFAWFVLLISLGMPSGGLMVLLKLLLYLICTIAAPSVIVGAFVYNAHHSRKYNMLRNIEQKRIQATPEFAKAKFLAEQRAQAATQQAIEKKRQEIALVEAQYANAVHEYETDILPKYKAAREKWTQLHNIKLEVVENDLNEVTNKLADLYNETKMISTHFRDVYKLTWIYEEMSSSQHDFDAAIQLLNDAITHDLLMNITSDVNNMHSSMLRGMHAMYQQLDAINENSAVTNEMLDEMSDHLRKTRRDINIGNIVATYQRHKFRKEFNEFRKKFA